MKIRNTIAGIILIAGVSFSISCDRDPVLPPEPVINHITIKQLRAMYDNGITTIDTNVYIQGVITLTPELGNVPDFIAYIQDSTAAICLAVTGTNSFAMNSEVKIFCRGVSFTLYNGLLQFGNIDIATQSELIKLTAEPLDPKSVTISELLEGKHQAEYVSLTGVQFKSAGTYSGTKVLTDCISEVDVYTRSAASFSPGTIPTGNGTLKGVASIFNSIQVLLRDTSELSMRGAICGVPSVTYLSQNFNSLTTNYTNVTSLAGWNTFSEAGTKTWFSYKTTTLGPFMETTAYNSGQATVITWMIAPQIDLSTATKPFISFESADGYNNGATLELFVSTDYTGSLTPWTSTWTQLTFTQPPVSTSGYSSFVSSGQVDLSAYNGSTVFLAWVYKGVDLTGTTTDKTTTWEVDNVLVAEK
jgi:hypothetical protein